MTGPRKGPGVERPSPAVQDYLKTIYSIGEERGDEGPVTTSQVAEALGVTAASASNMLTRLDQLGYVAQVKRRGVVLTAEGRLAALEVVRHHRLLETFLVDRLGLSWDEVHREAEVLEHHISETLEAHIAEALGHPERDPHGHPIPSVAGALPDSRADRLGTLDAGAGGRIVSVSDHDPELLRFLADLGLVPDRRIEVLERLPFGGPVRVSVEGADPVEVPPEAAAAVQVE